MGLPVWRAPSPEAQKDVLKADVTGQRSPIRRRARPTTRSARSPRLLDSDFLVSASRFADSISRPSSSRPRLPPPVPDSRDYSRQAEYQTNTPGLHRDDGILSRAQSRAHAHLARVYRTFDAERSALGDSRPLPAFTPNFAPAAASRYTRSDSVTEFRDRVGMRSRSPYHRVEDRSRSPGARRAYTGRNSNIIVVDESDDDSNDNNAVGFPPLRRMGRRTIADGPLPSSSLRESWSPTTLDGLGDRERSISPVDVEDHWETMLSTVAPDPLAPSADSSFTSAAASASFSNSHPSSRAGSSNSNSAASSRTHLTIPSRRHSPANELFIRACDTSDDDTASDTEEEDMDVRPFSFRRRSQQGLLADEPPSRNPQRYSRRVFDRSDDARAYVQSFYDATTSRDSHLAPERLANDQLDGTAEESRNVDMDIPALDQELRDARALLERLTRRDDVGDDFWASVGLTRPLADRIERIQRERL